MADSDKTKTIDGFAYWIENEENGVCYIPLNLCEKIMKLLKEQEEIIEQYRRADGFLAAHGWKWEGR